MIAAAILSQCNWVPRAGCGGKSLAKAFVATAVSKKLQIGRILTVPPWNRSAAFRRQNCGQQEGPGNRESMPLCGVLPPKGSAPVREISLPHWWYFQDAPRLECARIPPLSHLLSARAWRPNP